MEENSKKNVILYRIIDGTNYYYVGDGKTYDGHSKCAMFEENIDEAHIMTDDGAEKIIGKYLLSGVKKMEVY